MKGRDGKDEKDAWTLQRIDGRYEKEMKDITVRDVRYTKNGRSKEKRSKRQTRKKGRETKEISEISESRLSLRVTIIQKKYVK